MRRTAQLMGLGCCSSPPTCAAFMAKFALHRVLNSSCRIEPDTELSPAGSRKARSAERPSTEEPWRGGLLPAEDQRGRPPRRPACRWPIWCRLLLSSLQLLHAQPLPHALCNNSSLVLQMVKIARSCCWAAREACCPGYHCPASAFWAAMPRVSASCACRHGNCTLCCVTHPSCLFARFLLRLMFA